MTGLTQSCPEVLGLYRKRTGARLPPGAGVMRFAGTLLIQRLEGSLPRPWVFNAISHVGCEQTRGFREASVRRRSV